MAAVFMKVNHETLAIFVKFAGISMGLLMLVWLLALLTPKLAAIVDRIAGKKPDDAPSPERVEEKITVENYEVHSFFEDIPIFPKKDEKADKENIIENDTLEDNKNG